MKWICALAMCFAFLGCGEGDSSSKEGSAARPGTDAWLVGSWSLTREGETEKHVCKFWANHSGRMRELDMANDVDDAAWTIVGDTLVMLQIDESRESTPDMDLVREALAEYEADPDSASANSLWKMSNLAKDSFTITLESIRGTMEINAARIVSEEKKSTSSNDSGSRSSASASKPGTDAWLVGKWQLSRPGDDKSPVAQFWADHSARMVEPNDVDDAAWKIVGDTLVMLQIEESEESTPNMVLVREALAEYEAEPEFANPNNLWKMSSLAQDSFMISLETVTGRKFVISAVRILN